MSITTEHFERAQEYELRNWVKDTSNSHRILHELVEHGEIAKPLKEILTAPVERSLEVGVGCFGIGCLAVHLPELAGKITGVDPLPLQSINLQDRDLQRYIDALRTRVEYVQSPGEKLPFADVSFNLVACVNVVDHAQSPEAILSEIKRVLTPGGLFAFSVSTLSTAGEYKWKFNRWRHPNEWHFVAHPHTYQWHRADAMVRSFFPNVLWSDRPRFRKRVIAKGRMSYWIAQK
jgi:ubiquinone/menaquinone biosynthesis C-methylase UbiE